MKIGIVGIGVIAPIHIKALQNCDQDIVALCDVETDNCVKANEEFGLTAAVYADFQAMLEREALDAVHICTPHYLHADMICAALERNIHVLSEKPLAISEEQLSKIERAVHASSAQLGVCFQNRYNPSVLVAKEFFKDRPITSAYANLTWCRDSRYYASGAWRGTKAYEGGGVMINQAIHSLDILQWLCGMPQTVLAHVSNNSLQGSIEVEDTAFGMFTLESGGNFIVHATNTAKHSFPVYMAFRAGTDTVELSADNLILNGRFVAEENGGPAFGKTEWGSGHAALIRAYCDCIQKGEKFPIDFYEARKAVRLILRMYESEGREIGVSCPTEPQ